MEDFLRCLMSEGVRAVHCAPLPEPEGALRVALLWATSLLSAKLGYLLGLWRGFSGPFSGGFSPKAGGRDACAWKRADPCMRV